MEFDELDQAEPRRGLWLGLAAAVVVVGLVVGLIGWTLNSDRLKPRLIEAVQRATGRTLTISGATRFTLSFSPTVSMEDVALANPPGFSRPNMVTVARVEVGLALLPLLQHRLEVDHVTLVQPDVLLETNAAGRGNWLFSREPPPVSGGRPPGANRPGNTGHPASRNHPGNGGSLAGGHCGSAATCGLVQQCQPGGWADWLV